MSSLTTLRISTSKGAVVDSGVVVVTVVVAADAVVVVVVVVVDVVKAEVVVDVDIDPDEEDGSGVVELILMGRSISFSSVTDV